MQEEGRPIREKKAAPAVRTPYRRGTIGKKRKAEAKKQMAKKQKVEKADLVTAGCDVLKADDMRFGRLIPKANDDTPPVEVAPSSGYLNFISSTMLLR